MPDVRSLIATCDRQLASQYPQGNVATVTSSVSVIVSAGTPNSDVKVLFAQPPGRHSLSKRDLSAECILGQWLWHPLPFIGPGRRS